MQNETIKDARTYSAPYVLMWIVTLVTQGVILWLARIPTGFTDVVYIVPLDVVALVAWAATLVIRRRKTAVGAHGGFWFWAPLGIIAVGVILIISDVPLRIAFLLSRADLQRAAAMTISGRPQHSGDFPKSYVGNAGVYDIIGSGEVHPGQVSLVLEKPWFCSGSAVLVFSPQKTPNAFDVVLGDGWYAYRRYGHWI